MKKKLGEKLFLTLIQLLISFHLLAQAQTKNWLIGDVGLNFRSGEISVSHDFAAHNTNGIGIISDSAGNLVMYSDGINIWNRNHKIMPNGKNILPDGVNLFTLETIIIPLPGSKSVYYVFTTNAGETGDPSGLYVSVVDLSLDNGLGDLTVKGRKILNDATNKMSAIFHQNGKDIWLITNQFKTNNYCAFLITEKGISEAPIVSAVGKQITSVYDGQMKVSPDGKKLACSFNNYNSEGFDLFDFNDSSGVLSNPMNFTLPSLSRGCDGLEFSSDATKLFVIQLGSTGESGLYQFDISKSSFDKISLSRTLLNREVYNSYKQMQLAVDGKIYITKGGGGGGTQHLGVIENPNDIGLNCKIMENGLFLDGGSSVVALTPNFIQSYFFKTDFTVNNTCQGSLVDFKITNEIRLDSVRWFFGQGSTSKVQNPKFVYSKTGDYTVRLLAYYPGKTDTITKKITINPSPSFNLGNDSTVCSGHELFVAEGFKSYLWNTGATTRSVIITRSGQSKLTVENSYGCFVTDSVSLEVENLPIINLQDSIKLGNLESIEINPGNFKSYHWSTGENTSKININKEGWYSVTVENSAGCSTSKSFYVYKMKQPSLVNMYGWKLLNPLPSAQTALDMCFLNSQVGFIVNSSQILRTTDGGATWSVLMEISSGNRMAFKNNIGYVVGNNSAIYKSTYFGGGWNKLNVSFTDNLNAISLISEDTIRITSNRKLYASNDGGITWKEYSVNGVNILDSYFTGSMVGHLACSYGTILKTTDGGKTWKSTSSSSSSPSNVFKIYFIDKETGFASREHNSILKTTDGGETWKTITDTTDKIYSYHFLDKQTGFIAGIYGVIFKTTNGGLTWDWIGFQKGRIDGTSINRVYFIDTLTGFATGMSGRILKTTDGGKNWKEYSPTYGTVKQLQFVTDQIAYFLVGNTFYKTTDSGLTWKNIGPPNPTAYTTQFDFINANTGYCISGGEIGTSLYAQKVYKTVDGGITWEITNNGNRLLSDALYSIDFVDSNIGFASGGYNDVGTFKTEDGGNSWQRINDLKFGQTQFLNDKIGYALDNRLEMNKILKTMDGGKTWTSSFEIQEDIRSFHFPDESNGYLVGDNAVIYKTIDAGKTWQKLTVPSAYYTSVRFYNSSIGYIADSYGKLYRTANGGISWEAVKKPYAVGSIELFKQNIFVYGENGVVLMNKINDQQITEVIDNVDISDELRVFPNPTNKNLYFFSDNPIKSIELLDYNGRSLLVKRNENQINISQYIPGIYLVKVFTEKGLSIRKIIKN